MSGPIYVLGGPENSLLGPAHANNRGSAAVRRPDAAFSDTAGRASDNGARVIFHG